MGAGGGDGRGGVRSKGKDGGGGGDMEFLRLDRFHLEISGSMKWAVALSIPRRDRCPKSSADKPSGLF